MTNDTFDLLVIGGGSGGVACARRASEHGARVCLIEKDRLGGTCVNVGCVPKKIMWWAGNLRDILNECRQYGFNCGNDIKFDWKCLKHRRDASISRLNFIYDSNLKKNGVTVIKGNAELTGLQDENKNHKIDVEVSNSVKRTIKAKHLVIAVGSKTMKLGVPGEEGSTNGSADFFEWEEMPEKVAIVGAGYIAVELAGVLSALGAETHSFYRGDAVLRNFDPMISKCVTESLKHQGCHVHPRSHPASFTMNNNLVSIHLKDGSAVHGFNKVIVAIGRSPNTDTLNLFKVTDIKTSSKGHIIVDDWQNTPAERIYALGDVCGRVELTPMAIAAGRRLADRLFLKGFEKAKADYTNVPSVVFAHPPVGSVGMTEPQAREVYGDKNVLVYTSQSVNLFYNVFDCQPCEKPKTNIKVICLKDDEKILGIHIHGMGADEIIQGFGLALKMGATKSDLDCVVAVHPSAAEEVVTCAPWGLPHPLNYEKRVECIFSSQELDARKSTTTDS